MVNNQAWFNKEHSETTEAIEIEYELFQGTLIIENYAKLKDLYLHDVQKVEKVILRNLPQCQTCTFWDCGLQELVIEHCPQLKQLDVRKNSLTNLAFLANLEHLEVLALESNVTLMEILRSYQGEWKACQKDLQELSKAVRENPPILSKLREDLAFSQQKYQELKKFLKETFLLISQAAQQELVAELNRKIKRKSSLSAPGMTEELKLNIKAVVESAKEMKKELETELTSSGTKIQELEQKLAEQVTLCQEKAVALSTQQALTEELKKCWINAIQESAKKEFASTEKEAWEQRSKELEQELDEAKRKEYKLEEELTIVKNEIKYLRDRRKKQEKQNETFIQEIITQLPEKKLSTVQEQEILAQIKDLLGAKRIFLNARQTTIKGLQNCYNKLKGKQKYDRVEEVGKLINTVGGVADSLTFGIPRACVETVKLINNSFRKKFSSKRTEEFQELLVNDQENFFWLHKDIVKKTYQNLVNHQILDLKDKFNEHSLFHTKYKIFELDSSIWKDKPFSTAEEMEAVIKLLSENWSKLAVELSEEEKLVKEFTEYSAPREKRQLSESSQISNSQGEVKSLKIIAEQREYQAEPMEIEQQAHMEIPPRTNN